MRMFKYVFSFFAYLGFSLTAFSYNVSGRVVDNKGLPLQFVNIVLCSSSDSSFVSGTVSDENGLFYINASYAGNCFLRFSLLGYSTEWRTIGNNSTDSVFVSMKGNATTLNEVTVKASPAYSLHGNTLNVTVAGGNLSKAGTVFDVLSKLPGVWQENHEITVLGKGAPAIYVGNRRLHELSELDRISSEDVQSVQVLNNPGGRYDASVRAVIIIKLKKKAGDGLGGNIYGTAKQAHSLSAMSGFHLNYRNGGLDIFGGYTVDAFRNYQKQRNNNHVLNGYDEWRLLSDIRIHPKGVAHDAELGTNYQINGNSSIGLRYSFHITPDRKSLWNTQQQVLLNKSVDDSLDYTANWKAKDGALHSVNCYYDAAFGKWTFHVDNDFYRGDNTNNQNVEQLGMNSGLFVMKSRSSVRNMLAASKGTAGYATDNFEMEYGYDFSRTVRKQTYKSDNAQFPNTSDEIKQTLAAGFASCSLTLGDLELDAGIRYEHVVADYYENKKLVSSQSRTYNNWFPDLGVSYPIGNVNLSLSYSAYTRRPVYSELSSNLQYDDRFTYEKGNPLLRSETTHDITLESVWNWLYFSGSWQYVKDAIAGDVQAYAKGTPISVMSNRNYGHINKYSIVLSLNPSFGIYSPQCVLNILGQRFYVDTQGSSRGMNRPLCYLVFNNYFNTGHGLIFTVGFSGHTEGDMDIVRMKRSWQMQADISKTFGNWYFQLQANDIFRSARNSMITYGVQTALDKWNYSDSQNIKFTVRYTFNSSNNKYKGKDAAQDEKNRL